jgi:hypothetical protein
MCPFSSNFRIDWCCVSVLRGIVCGMKDLQAERNTQKLFFL